MEILEPLLVREYEDKCFGLKFEGKIINEGDLPTVAKKGKAFLYLSNGQSIKTNFVFGIKGIKEGKGYLFPQKLDPHTSYELGGFEVQPHALWSKDIMAVFDRPDLTLKIEVRCSNLKKLIIRCSTKGELKENKLKSFFKELRAKFNEIEI